MRLARGIWIYLRALRLGPTARHTWPARRPAFYPFLLFLGVLSAVLTVVAVAGGRPFVHVYSQGVMALYFLFMAPLLTRIRHGLYEGGVWADAGFLPYGEIGRMAFREGREIVLVLLPRNRSRPFRLRVPPAEYGAVQKVLDEKVRSHELKTDQGLLGL